MQSGFFLFSVSDVIVCVDDGCFGVPEKEGDAPNARKGNKRIYDSAENRTLTAENPGNKVELKKTDAAPVESADDNKGK
jgi:hypothetical protein